MSAPKKIWAASPAEGCFFTARDWQSNDDDDLYHHDDVVRELVEALAKVRRAYEELRDTVEGECPSLLNEDSGASQVLLNAVLDADAALAKIAQEG